MSGKHATPPIRPLAITKCRTQRVPSLRCQYIIVASALPGRTDLACHGVTIPSTFPSKGAYEIRYRNASRIGSNPYVAIVMSANGTSDVFGNWGFAEFSPCQCRASLRTLQYSRFLDHYRDRRAFGIYLWIC